jgi:hypothetical protein
MVVCFVTQSNQWNWPRQEMIANIAGYGERRGWGFTDESMGKEVPATSAWFVRSRVETVPHTRNRIPAFRAEAAARRHADVAGGVVLGESPFAQSQAGSQPLR